MTGAAGDRGAAGEPPSVVLHRGDGGFRFNVMDADGTVLATSKRFDTAAEARDGYDRARTIIEAGNIVDQEAGDGPLRADSSTATRPQ